jgi:GNAT superfamily N-acetyltransferase
VAERWQGKGLAKLMLTKIEYRAATAGIRRIVGETFATNEKMISLARKAGFVISDYARGVVRLEKMLPLEITAASALSDCVRDRERLGLRQPRRQLQPTAVR